ncbi:TPA: hypothetical protein ACT36N_002091, partial [Neisseria meningitidis]
MQKNAEIHVFPRFQRFFTLFVPCAKTNSPPTICANQTENAKYRLKIFQTVFAVFIAVFLPYPDFCLGLKQIGSQIAIKE